MKKIFLLYIIIFTNLVFCNDRVTFEKVFYDKYINSVFTVFGDAGHGTGFLIDNQNGLIATNYHVISNSRFIRVKINQNLKIEGRVVAKSMYDDMAIIQVNPEITKNRENCILAPSDYQLYIGETIYAIGSPLNQTEVFTKGIISRILDRAILSGDLNINHGNSGGPLFNFEEYVIGINTFGDVDSGGKLSGIIKINSLYPLINEALNFIANNNNIPSTNNYPTMPTDLFPLEALKESVYEYFHEKDYRIKNSKFHLNVVTPPFSYNRKKSTEVDLAEIRNKRSEKAGVDDSDLLHDWLFDDLYSWANYANAYEPVVRFEISPKIKPTAGAIIGAMLTGYAAGYSGTPMGPIHWRGKYKSDLYDFKLFRDNKEIQELKRFVRFERAVYFSSDYYGNTTSIKDMAKGGFYEFSIHNFAPIDGKFPEIRIDIYDLSKPDKAIPIKIKSKTVEKIWEDFLPYTSLNKKNAPDYIE